MKDQIMKDKNSRVFQRKPFCRKQNGADARNKKPSGQERRGGREVPV